MRRQPFESFLPYPEFSVRVLEEEIPHMHEILEKITEADVRKMQSALECVRHRFYFSSILGDFAAGSEGLPDAFETLMDGLSKRYDNMDDPKVGPGSVHWACAIMV